MACGSPASQPDAGRPDAGDVVRGPCDAPPTFADGLVPTRTLYVEAGASGGDGSMAAPFGTIQAAAAVATPGTWIRLGPGMHATDQYVAALRGTTDAPIWIGGEANQPAPVIAGGGVALHLVRPAYVVLRHIEVRGQTANGINIDDGDQRDDETAAHHVLVSDVAIHDVGGDGNQDCLKVSGVNDLYVYDSQFARCGGAASGSGIDHVGCHRVVIARNIFDAMTGNAVQAKGGSTDIDIRQNRVRDGGERAFNLGGSTGLQFFRPSLSTTAPNAEARRIRAFDNIVTGTTVAPFAFVGCIDCVAAHNLVLGTPRWLVRILQETVTQSGYTFEPAANGRVINNSFLWTASVLSTHVNVGANTAPATFTFSHNVWHATDDPARSTPMLPVAEAGAVIGMGSVYNAVPSDPYASLDRLCAQGPEVSAATALPEVDGTIDGACRYPTSSALPPTIGPQVYSQADCGL